MKFIRNYSGLVAIGLWLYSFLFAGGTENAIDYGVSIGPKAKLIETGSLFKLKYNDTNKFTIAKLTSGNVTFSGNAGYIFSGTLETSGNFTGTGTNNAINGLNVGTSSGLQKLNVFGGADIQDSIIIGSFCYLTEKASNPIPTAGTKTVLYMKADKFIICYDHGGTTKFRYIDLTGTDATWTYTTTPP